MEIETITLRNRGQIVIPQRFRQELNLQTGEVMIMLKQNNELVIKKKEAILNKTKLFSQIDKAKLGGLLLSEKTLAKDWSSKEDDVWDKY